MIDAELDRILEAMSKVPTDSENYGTLLKRAENLLDMELSIRDSERKWKIESANRQAADNARGWMGVSKDVLASVAGHLFGLGAIILYETNHVWRTRALAYLPKIK